MALIAQVDARTEQLIDTATGLAPTVVALRACDPARAAENAAFLDAWDALDLNVSLVLIAAEPHQIGTEVADYIDRHFSRRQVHVVIGATPTADEYLPLAHGLVARPSAQLGRSLHRLPNVVLHWVIWPNPGRRPARPSGSSRWPRARTRSHESHSRLVRPGMNDPGSGSSVNASTTRLADAASGPSCEPPTPTVIDLMRDPGVQFAMSVVAGLVCVALCARLQVPTYTATVLVGLVAAAGTVASPLRWRMLSAVASWAALTGFLVHNFGVLTFEAPDLRRLGIMLFLAAGARLVAPRAGRQHSA